MEITQIGILEVNLQNKSESILEKLLIKFIWSLLKNIQEEPMDVSHIAASLQMTEANISAQIKKLEEAGLIDCSYSSGNHGVRKISRLKFNKLIIEF